ncbi:preprotein translocase subunit YajC [uncultured Brevundimonas sp.]|uniref:preprotein translocase subunit YajC n=1 Tax=uncultured Brevundimonas sp. TaxID=213418 RepID=UPI0030ECFD89
MQGILEGPFGTLIFFVPVIVLFYFMLIRPQAQQAKRHRAMIAAVKRGDTVVMSNGMVGKVTRVETDEAMVEISQGVNVRVIKSMIAEVRDRTAIAANDAKA